MTEAASARRWSTPLTVALGRSALVALAIAFVPQGIWSALIVLNLRTTPGIPWATAIVILAVGIGARSLRGRPQRSHGSATRRQPPRANLVPTHVLMSAWLAGALAVVALTGYWIILASFVHMPGSVLPDLSRYPWWTAGLAVLTGAAISPLCEQVGFWGYWQVALEREFSGFTATICTSAVFAVLPHPPAAAPLWPKWLFFFATGWTFSAMAYLTDSILPGLGVHAVALLTFFTIIWPYDTQRRLVGQGGADVWLAIHVAQAAFFSLFAHWAFRRLRRVGRPSRAESSPTTVVHGHTSAVN